MSTQTNIPVLILAGGASHRFGSPKGLARLNGSRLIDIVCERLRVQTSGPIAINAHPDGPYRDMEHEIVPDTHKDQPGPLAGLYAAMSWASTNGKSAVITVPIDIPFLPLDLVSKLQDAGAPAIASSRKRHHPVCGLWPAALKDDLNTQLEKGMRVAHAWAEHCRAQPTQFPLDQQGRDPFFNINTREDLAKAQSR